jgi:hypothetical protein
VAQGIGPEFKPQYYKKKEKKIAIDKTYIKKTSLGSLVVFIFWVFYIFRFLFVYLVVLGFELRVLCVFSSFF